MNAADVRLRVAALVETLGVDGFVTVAEVAEHVAASPRSIGQALKRLGFTMSRRKEQVAASKGRNANSVSGAVATAGGMAETGSRRNDNNAQLAPLNLPQSRARSRPFVPDVRPWSLPLTKPRHLQLADPWGGRERSAPALSLWASRSRGGPWPQCLRIEGGAF